MRNWLGLAKLAFSNLKINKLRSILTVFGMMFGTGAVIATLSSNEGAAQYIRGELEKLGTANLVVRSSDPGATLQERDLEPIRNYSRLFNSLNLLSVTANAHLRYESHVTDVTIQGVTPALFDANKLSLATGRIFDPVENQKSRPVVVLGGLVKKQLFGDYDPIAARVHLFVNDAVVALQVIGVLPEKGGAAAQIDSAIFIPRSLLEKLTPERDRQTVLVATLQNEEQSQEAKAQLQALMKGRFPSGIEVADSREAIERTKNIWGKQNLVGICLAFISLITGGVGIMNIMLLSVAQRRKEIGLRKAVGAAESHILLQFLLEALIVCFFGGVLGIIVGVLFGQQVAQMMGQWEAKISLGTIFSALGFSMLTGVVFGLLPALRASRMDPYEALRN